MPGPNADLSRAAAYGGSSDTDVGVPKELGVGVGGGDGAPDGPPPSR